MVRLPAVYRSLNLTIDAYVSNISQGGLNLSCDEVDAEGTEGEVVLTLPGQSETIQFSGRVIWADPSSPAMGFCFDSLSRENRLALANFLIARYYSS